MIELRGKDQITAKIFDFTNSIDITEPEKYESNIRDEFYRFGLVIFKHIYYI
jgi:hypothetical protein